MKRWKRLFRGGPAMRYSPSGMRWSPAARFGPRSRASAIGNVERAAAHAVHRERALRLAHFEPLGARARRRRDGRLGGRRGGGGGDRRLRAGEPRDASDAQRTNATPHRRANLSDLAPAARRSRRSSCASLRRHAIRRAPGRVVSASRCAPSRSRSPPIRDSPRCRRWSASRRATSSRTPKTPSSTSPIAIDSASTASRA